MANFSMTSDDDEQPLLRLIQHSSTGAAASIRIDDPNPDIEFVETGLTNPDAEAGKFEIAVQDDRFQINGRRAAGSPVKGFDVIAVFQRPAAGGNVGVGFTRNSLYGDFGGGRGAIVIAGTPAAPTHNVAGAGVLYVENGALKFRGSNGTVSEIAPA